MKKLKVLVSLGLVAAMCLTACGTETKKADEAEVYQIDESSMDVCKFDVDSYISELGEYTGLTIEVNKKMEVTDETIDSYISYSLQNSGYSKTKTEVDRAVKTGDVVNIDYIGTKDDVAFEGGTGTSDLEIGSGKFIAGFEDGLIGHKKGEIVELNLTFPENYGATDLAGQDVVFYVTINAVYEQKDPELTDEIVGQLNIENVSTVEEFRAYLKAEFLEDVEESYKTSMRQALLDQIYEKTSFAKDTVPETLMHYYVTQATSSDQANASSYGTTIEEYVEVMYSQDYTTYMNTINETAKKNVRQDMICRKIAMIEGISISDTELEEELAKLASDYGYASVDEILKVIDKDFYKNYLLKVKVMDKLLENTTVNEIESTPASAEATTESAEVAESTTEESTTEAATEATSETASTEE